MAIWGTSGMWVEAMCWAGYRWAWGSRGWKGGGGAGEWQLTGGPLIMGGENAKPRKSSEFRMESPKTLQGEYCPLAHLH